MDQQAFAGLLANYAEEVGAIAVVVTLIYLAAQIRQNNELLRSSSRQSLVANVGQTRSRAAANALTALTLFPAIIIVWKSKATKRTQRLSVHRAHTDPKI